MEGYLEGRGGWFPARRQNRQRFCFHILPAELAAGLHGASRYKILFLQFGHFLTVYVAFAMLRVCFWLIFKLK